MKITRKKSSEDCIHKEVAYIEGNNEFKCGDCGEEWSRKTESEKRVDKMTARDLLPKDW